MSPQEVIAVHQQMTQDYNDPRDLLKIWLVGTILIGGFFLVVAFLTMMACSPDLPAYAESMIR